MKLAEAKGRQQAIIEHIVTYRLSLKATITKLFFEGNEGACGAVLYSLQKKKWIQSVGGLYKGFRYYRLTESEAIRRGLDESYYNPRNPTLHEDLAVLWFCLMGPVTRHRLSAAQVKEGLGKLFPGPHCVEKCFITRDGVTEKLNRTHWVYVPGTRTREGTIIKKVVTHLERVAKSSLENASGLSPKDWLEDRQYGAAILVDNEARRDRLDKLLDGEKRAIRKLAHVIVEITPSPTSLKEAFDELPHKEPSPNTQATKGPKKKAPR